MAPIGKITLGFQTPSFHESLNSLRNKFVRFVIVAQFSLRQRRVNYPGHLEPFWATACYN